MVEIIATEQNIEKWMKRNEASLRDIWNNIKHTNIRIIGVPVGLILGLEDPLEEEMATHSSTTAWKIPWTEGA